MKSRLMVRMQKVYIFMQHHIFERCAGFPHQLFVQGDVVFRHMADPPPAFHPLELDFDGRRAVYGAEQLNEVDLAFAMTVHKSQGSEYRCVVLAAMPAPSSLMVRGAFSNFATCFCVNPRSFLKSLIRPYFRISILIRTSASVRTFGRYVKRRN